MTKLSPSPSPTRQRILEAAFTLFGRYGFRRTSMEDIAGQAGLSRTALYLQFRNKEEIFRELATNLHEEALTQAEEALAGGGSLAERLPAAVEAKTVRMIEIIQSSPHGAELTDEKNRLCGDLATDSERRFHRSLTRAFSSAAEARELDLEAAGLTAPEAAELFARALTGLKGPDVPLAAYRRKVRALVNVFLRGLGGG